MITFTKANLPYGWLGNMVSKDLFPLEYDGLSYKSSEALFQCLRFPNSREAQEAIRSSKSPWMAKKRATLRKRDLKVPLRDDADLARMRFCLVLKLKFNPQLIAPLCATFPDLIVEDCTSRPNDTEIDGTTTKLPFWGAIVDGTKIEGDNALGKLWVEIRYDIFTKGMASALSPKGDTIEVSKDAPCTGKAAFAEQVNVGSPDLTYAEKKALNKYEAAISDGRKAVEHGFTKMVRAMYAIFQERLYRQNGRTFAEYFRTKWMFERAHSYRLIHCGRLLETMKSAALSEMTSQAHFRPLLATADDAVIQSAVAQIEDWRAKVADLKITPSLVESAVALVRPPTPPQSSKRDPKLLTSEVLKRIDTAKRAALKSPRAAAKAFKELESEIAALGVTSSTGISWTNVTWNPLQGCKKISAGCQRCYAAEFLATRLKSRYPGIAETVSKPPKGSSQYQFTGKVSLLMDALNEPLGIKTPKRIFVNSLSDLFYEPVPDWFIDSVFDVMEKASWHQFQVLTKRPERMATYTQRRYAARPPPHHIWLGATIEDQIQHDLRMPHLQKVVAAIRWISCEPLLKPVVLNLANIHWVVLGGESGSTPDRKMDKAWAISIRLQCRKARVPFFFKQWGDCGEDGKPNKHVKENGPETLGGDPHPHNYPAAA